MGVRVREAMIRFLGICLAITALLGPAEAAPLLGGTVTARNGIHSADVQVQVEIRTVRTRAPPTPRDASSSTPRPCSPPASRAMPSR